MLPKKTLLLIILIETIFVFVLSVIGNKVANLVELSTGMLFGLSLVCIGGVAYLGYLKVSKPDSPSTESKSSVRNDTSGPVSMIANAFLTYRAKRLAGLRKPINGDAHLLKCFLSGSIGNMVAFCASSLLPTENLRMLVMFTIYFVVGIFTFREMVKGTGDTQYIYTSNVIEEIIEMLLLAYLYFPIPGVLTGGIVLFIISWLFGIQKD
jgi:hypothetical protein